MGRLFLAVSCPKSGWQLAVRDRCTRVPKHLVPSAAAAEMEPWEVCQYLPSLHIADECWLITACTAADRQALLAPSAACQASALTLPPSAVLVSKSAAAAHCLSLEGLGVLSHCCRHPEQCGGAGSAAGGWNSLCGALESELDPRSSAACPTVPWHGRHLERSSSPASLQGHLQLEPQAT